MVYYVYLISFEVNTLISVSSMYIFTREHKMDYFGKGVVCAHTRIPSTISAIK